MNIKNDQRRSISNDQLPQILQHPLTFFRNKNILRIEQRKKSDDKHKKSNNKHRKGNDKNKKSALKRLLVSCKQTYKQNIQMPKHLQKNKKHHRFDLRNTITNNIYENDVFNIMRNITQEKLQNDSIVLGLRKKFLRGLISQNKHKSNQQKCYDTLNFTQKLTNNKESSLSIINFFTSSNYKKHTRIFNKTHSKHTIDVLKALSNEKECFIQDLSILTNQIKSLKKQLAFYINKLKTQTNTSITSEQSSKIGDKSQSKKTQRRKPKFQKLYVQVENVTSNLNLRANFYKQYLKLSEQSYDFLQYYLKANSLQQDLSNNNIPIITPYSKVQIQQILVNSKNKVILFVIKSNFRCFQKEYNLNQIINRLLLAFNINSRNEFQIVQQNVYISLKKLINTQFNKKQMKQFIIKYLFLDKYQITKSQFEIIMFNIFKKFIKVINLKTIQTLFNKFINIQYKLDQLSQKNQQRSKQNKNKQIQNKQNNLQQTNSKDKNLTKSQLKAILSSDPLFLWNQIIQLIFII